MCNKRLQVVVGLPNVGKAKAGTRQPRLRAPGRALALRKCAAQGITFSEKELNFGNEVK